MDRQAGDVAPADWLTFWQQGQQDGFTWWDTLAATDGESGITVLARALRPGDGVARSACVHLDPDAAVLTSLSSVFGGATWCEREVAEMLGVLFVGLSDNRTLLLRAPAAVPPLSRRAWLDARSQQPWPGAARDPGEHASGARRSNPAGRRQRPIGVPDEQARMP